MVKAIHTIYSTTSFWKQASKTVKLRTQEKLFEKVKQKSTSNTKYSKIPLKSKQHVSTSN